MNKEGTIVDIGGKSASSYVCIRVEKRQTKAFVERHRKQNEKMFEVDKLVLVFQTKMGLMLGKLRFRWTTPFWIINNKNGTYQVRMLTGEILLKWVNGFLLK